MLCRVLCVLPFPLCESIGLRRHLPRWIATGEVVRRQTAMRNSEVMEPSTPLRDLEAGAGVEYPAR